MIENKMTQRIKRSLSTKRQLTIPSEFAEGVDAYVIEESTTEQDQPTLTLYPITEESQ
jgi:hypothetical protein